METNYSNEHYKDALDLLQDLQKDDPSPEFQEKRARDIETITTLLTGDAASVTEDRLNNLHVFMDAVNITHA